MAKEVSKRRKLLRAYLSGPKATEPSVDPKRYEAKKPTVKVKKYEKGKEQLICVGLVMNTSFLAKVVASEYKKFLENTQSKRVLKVCTEYFRHNGSAPKSRFRTLYEAKYDDDDDSGFMESFFIAMGRELEEVDGSATTYIEAFTEYVRPKALDQVKEDIDFSIDRNDPKSLGQVAGLLTADIIRQSNAIMPFSSPKHFEDAYQEQGEPILEFEGALGEFFRGQFRRSTFYAIQAPEKLGKSWWLLWFVIQGLRQGRRVALFEVGDMSQGQTLLRLATMLAGKSTDEEFCGKVSRPTGFRKLEFGEERRCCLAPNGYDLDYEEYDTGAALSKEEAFEVCVNYFKDLGIDVEKLLIFEHISSGESSVADIKSTLDGYHSDYDGWLPDLIVADYMELMGQEPSTRDFNDRVRDNWAAANDLAKEYPSHPCFISATQSDEDAYDGKLQTRSNFSRDKRKNSFVDGMIGLACTSAERAAGMMRMNWPVLRNGILTDKDYLCVAQSLRTGQVMIDAVLVNSFDQSANRPSESREDSGVPERSRRGSNRRGRKSLRELPI